MVVTLSQVKPLKALEIEGLYTTKAPVTLIQPQEDDTIYADKCCMDSYVSYNHRKMTLFILINVAWILMSAIILVLAGVIL